MSNREDQPASSSPLTSGCVFCQIALGETDTRLIYADEQAVVFLDHRPVFVGHCLVVPKVHIPTLPDLPPEDLGPFFWLVQRVSKAVESGMGADGTFVAINNKISQSVPHLHVHVIPRRKKDGLRGFFWPRQKYASPEASEKIARAIETALIDTV